MAFSTIDEAIQAIADKRIVIVVDDEDPLAPVVFWRQARSRSAQALPAHRPPLSCGLSAA